jgi:GTPase SAR1 family protein
MLLIRGDPGSGKSTVLLQFLANQPSNSVVASVIRAPGHADAFDSLTLISSIIDGLTNLGIRADQPVQPPMPGQISVKVDVGEVQAGGAVNATVLNLATTAGVLPVAERLVRATPRINASWS